MSRKCRLVSVRALSRPRSIGDAWGYRPLPAERHRLALPGQNSHGGGAMEILD